MNGTCRITQKHETVFIPQRPEIEFLPPQIGLEFQMTSRLRRRPYFWQRGSPELLLFFLQYVFRRKGLISREICLFDPFHFTDVVINVVTKATRYIQRNESADITAINKGYSSCNIPSQTFRNDLEVQRSNSSSKQGIVTPSFEAWKALTRKWGFV